MTLPTALGMRLVMQAPTQRRGWRKGELSEKRQGRPTDWLVPRSELAHEIAAFVIDRQARGLSPRTVEFYADEVRYLRGFLEGQKLSRVEQITPDLLRGHLLHLGKSRNPGGLHAAYRAVRAFIRWYGREYEPQDWTNPMDKVAAPRVPQKPLDPATLSDLKAMQASCERRTFVGDRDRAILLALLDTECRASEFVALNVADVNLSSGVVIIRTGKGSKFRTAFLSAKKRREVVRYLRHRDDSDALWLTVQGPMQVAHDSA